MTKVITAANYKFQYPISPSDHLPVAYLMIHQYATINMHNILYSVGPKSYNEKALTTKLKEENAHICSQ